MHWHKDLYEVLLPTLLPDLGSLHDFKLINPLSDGSHSFKHVDLPACFSEVLLCLLLLQVVKVLPLLEQRYLLPKFAVVPLKETITVGIILGFLMQGLILQTGRV